MSLPASFQSDLFLGLHQCREKVHALGDRVSLVVDQMSEYTTFFNTMVDAYEMHSEDIIWIKYKLADLEDRFRCNNLKFQGIP